MQARSRGRRSAGTAGTLNGAHKLTGLVLVAILVAGVFVWRSLADGCGGNREKVTVITDAAFGKALKPIADTASDNSCYDYRITELANVDVPANLSAGNSSADLWVADSLTRAQRVTQQVRIKTDIVAESLATSPVVLVGSGIGDFKDWNAIMNLANLQVGSPIETSTGEAPIIGGAAEVAAGKLNNSQFFQSMAQMAVRRHNVAEGLDNDNARLRIAASSDSPAITSEQQYLQYLRANPTVTMSSTIPASGTVMLTYPLVNTASVANRDRATTAGQALADAALSKSGRARLVDNNFRDADGHGNGDEVKVVKFDDAEQISKASQIWQAFAVPTRMLQILDTSGSMRSPAGNSTRATLVANATIEGMTLLANDAQVGMWIFGIDKGGPRQDWKEVAEVQRMDHKIGGTSHRERITTLVRSSMKNDLGGGTGLYDTTLAAYKKMLETYDPTTTNLIGLVTDGQNEDASSITRDELLAQLKVLHNPGRPVRILSIGVTDDADAESLKLIADATGGTAYIARDPTDMKGMFTREVDNLVRDFTR
ncbi:VWA domain-containing protein [Gordonia pseudamarae]|uniref:VWA domain-containing protein n=1 Tax=Gordonia pseudamarae TaxID=2831662 RepID=A0ABX6IFJ2_9ACTN|nr:MULTISPECIES: substrate-binding domain-containing protein [Gordonia]MBD0021596.1 substrate-binding domain-containing protein [Gordonia sp. (in: high G+C Gram-positive bacteria)]QHN25122.1 VWA domain-containing protein [Gordonia pseudamarae]QHN34055.1 VWA domain-containing protein [Gordonia pseudamarae]